MFDPVNIIIIKKTMAREVIGPRREIIIFLMALLSD